jgi:hypothetical protein
MTDSMRHMPRGTVGPKVKLSLKLEGADSLLGRTDQAESLNPLGEGDMAILEDCPNRDRELVGGFGLPAVGTTIETNAPACDGDNALAVATGTNRTTRPADSLKGHPGLILGHLRHFLEGQQVDIHRFILHSMDRWYAQTVGLSSA